MSYELGSRRSKKKDDHGREEKVAVRSGIGTESGAEGSCRLIVVLCPD